MLAFDVSSARTRRRLVRTLMPFGVRVQFSVFELVLSEEEIDALWVTLGALLDAEEDRAVLYPRCMRCKTGRRRLGRALGDMDPTHFII